MPPTPALLDLLLELQALDRLPRTGYRMRGVPEAESVSEHSFHVVFLVWALAGRVPDVDGARAVEMALVHDLAELRVGDLPMTAAHYFPEGAKRQAELAAARELLAPLPERALELFEEYEAGESPEARLVKACDKLQLMLKVSVYESWGAGDLEDFWGNPGNFGDGSFAPVRELFDALRERRAASPAGHPPEPPPADRAE